MKLFLASMRGLSAPLQTSFFMFFFFLVLALVSWGHRSGVVFGLHEGSLCPPSDLLFFMFFFFLFLALVSGVTGVKCFLASLRGLSDPSRPPSVAVFLFVFFGSGFRSHRSEVLSGLHVGPLRPPPDLHQWLFFFFFFGSGVRGHRNEVVFGLHEGSPP